MAQIKRIPRKQATLGIGDVASVVYNGRAGANKVMIVGPEIQGVNGSPQASGQTANAADLLLNPGTTIGLFNNSGSVAWATTSTAAIATLPTSITNAIPLKPNDWTYINMGESRFLRTSAATVGVYIIQDDTGFTVTPDDQAM